MDLQFTYEEASICTRIQIAAQVDGIARGDLVEVGGRRGRVFGYRCNGDGKRSAWVDFTLPSGDVVGVLVPLSELRRVK